MKRKSIYTKLLMSGFILCVLPVLAIGSFSYIQSAEAVRARMDQANVDLLNQLTKNVEQILKTTDTNLNQVVNSSALQDALYLPITFKQFSLYNNFRKNLSNLQSVDSPVSDVVLLNYSNNWLINNERLYEFDKFPKKQELLRFNELPYDSYWSLKPTSSLGSPSTEVSGCKYTITLSKKLPVSSSEKRGLALAYIPSCSLSDGIELQSGTQELVIIGPDHRVIYDKNLSLIGKPIPDTGDRTVEIVLRMKGTDGQFNIDSDSKPYTLTYHRSDYNGWLYLLKTGNQLVSEQSREIGWVIISVSLIIILLSLGFVWLGSQRIYTPIRGILQSISKRQQGLPQQTQDEFQLINDHIERLFASNSSMKKEISQSHQQLRAFFLTKLFQGQLKKSEIADKMKLYGFGNMLINRDCFVVLTLRIDGLEQSRYAPGDLDLLLFAANNIVEESIPADHGLMPVIVDQTQVTLFGFSGLTAEQLHQRVDALTEAIRANIDQFLQLHVSIGISLPFRHIHEAARAYWEGLEALKHRMKLGEGVTVYFASINAGTHSFMYRYPSQLQNKMLDSIKLADEDKALEGLREWMNEVFSEDRIPSDYQMALIRLLNDLLIVCQESAISLKQEEEENSFLYNELLQLYVPREIEQWFVRKLVKPMVHSFRGRAELQYRNVSESLIDLIQQRYDSDITLEECASILHYNTNYLGKVFKKETNLSFSDYLSMYRLSMAKKWLVESDVTVKEIAQRLNYNNAQNFIRSFRKQEGMTPGQYREKMAR